MFDGLSLHVSELCLRAEKTNTHTHTHPLQLILFIVVKRSYIEEFTIFPLCWADLVSRRLNTFPHTDISLHIPGLESSVNPLRGCITRTPLVVRPSICPSDVFHLAAFSCNNSEVLFRCNLEIETCVKECIRKKAFYPKKDVF